MDKYLEETYIKLTPREHILKRPGMYISRIDFKLNNLFIFDNNKIIDKEIMYNEGLNKIIDEIITNAIDQTIKDSSLTLISVKINSESLILFNNGIGIDIAIHPIHKIYIPQLIFSELLSSTNYNDEIGKVVGGTYGIGIKLSVIFSKKFEINIWDSKRKLYYHQIYEDNLSKISKPIIKKYKIINDENIDKKYLKSGGVKIIIYPDFDKFNTTKFDDDIICLIKRRILDLIVLTRKNVNIFINNENIDRGLNNIETYLNLYNLNNNHEWIIGHCIKNLDWQYAIRFYKNINSNNLTFVNGVYTNRGGTHLNYFIDLIFEKIKKIIGVGLTKKILLENIIIFLKTSIINPTFSSQSKDELTTPINKFGFQCEIPESFFNNLKNSKLIDELKNIILQSNQKILSKFDGSKKNKIKFIPKLEDANFAGTKKSSECTLILTEGDSAKATAIAGLSGIKNGRNYYGVYPLRGKLLNIRDSSTKQINNNQEIQDITKIMGLKLGTIYSKDNINQIRYGSIMIMTDADEDGSHIKGLIINYLDFFYPSLLYIQNFLKVLVTPLIKATYKQTIINFANIREYNQWKNKNIDYHLWKIKYYKGLGTSTSKEAVEYFQNIDQNINYIYNIIDNDLLLAFSKNKISERKNWLLNYNPNNILDTSVNKNISIKEFINSELIHFSNYDNIRSIPSICDGLKPSQRKILYTCLKRNLINEIKVAQLASSVAENTSYHHGEQSLVSTIINMCQNFIGSNNLSLLVNQGQFGTRLMGGKDHSSARYIYTYLEKYVNKIFNKEDNELLNYLEDEGSLIEPLNYLPIIPLILINGAEGIGTGFSTNIPNFNQNDIINWLLNKLKNIHDKNKKKLIPYYKNFKGNIFKYDNSTWISCGKIEFFKNELHVIELPIKLWTNDYKFFLEELIYEKKDSLIKSYINLSSDIDIKFILKFNDINYNKILNMYKTIDLNNMNDLYKYLHLYKTIKQSNMHLYTSENKIKIFNSAEDILEYFYSFRLPFFNKRKELILNKINENIKFINNQINFIKLVIKNKGNIYKIKDIETYLEQNNFIKYENSYNYLINLTFKQLSQTNLEKLELKLLDLKKEYNELLNTTDNQIWIKELEELQKII